MKFRLTPESAPGKRHFSGQRAQKKGQAFETLIEESAAQQSAIVEVEMLPKMGAFRVAGGKLVTCKICCDGFGSFINGPAIAFDAKATGGESLPASMLKEHQLDFLRRYDRTGQIAGLLVKAEALGLFLWRDIKRIDGDAMPFKRDGALLSSWHVLGPVSGWVDFKALREIYE